MSTTRRTGCRVRASAQQGMDAYLLDWGEPGEAELAFDTTDYIEGVIVPALEEIKNTMKGVLAGLQCHRIMDAKRMKMRGTSLLPSLRPDLAADGCTFSKAKYLCTPSTARIPLVDPEELETFVERCPVEVRRRRACRASKADREGKKKLI